MHHYAMYLILCKYLAISKNGSGLSIKLGMTLTLACVFDWGRVYYNVDSRVASIYISRIKFLLNKIPK